MRVEIGRGLFDELLRSVYNQQCDKGGRTDTGSSSMTIVKNCCRDNLVMVVCDRPLRKVEGGVWARSGMATDADRGEPLRP